MRVIKPSAVTKVLTLGRGRKFCLKNTYALIVLAEDIVLRSAKARIYVRYVKVNITRRSAIRVLHSENLA
jgi:hypothetical protein